MGTLGIIIALFLLPPSICLTLIGALGFGAAALAGLDRTLYRSWWLTLVLLFCGLALPSVWPRAWLVLRMSEYKGLPQALRLPEATVVSERFSPLGILTVVRSPTIPFRYAPGLSLRSPAAPPPQLGVFLDGAFAGVITQYSGKRETLTYFDYLPSALPYLLQPRPHVLILGAGGGTDVLQARYFQARSIDAVELNPQLVDLVRQTFAAFAGHIYTTPGVRVYVTEARSFVAASRQRYNMIFLGLHDTFGVSAAGALALSTGYLYTVEAIQDYLRHLRPGGFLAIPRWLKLPPRDSLKLFLTALVAMERLGVPQPAQRLALIRSWQTTLLLVKQGPLTAGDITTIRAFCTTRGFDLVYYPGITATEVNRFSVLATPLFFQGALALASEQRRAFLRRYQFRLAPATDNRPYFSHFFTWRALLDLLALRGQGSVALLEWGYLILIATLVQAMVASIVLILLPLVLLRHTAAGWRSRVRVGIYFLALGLAFLFIEIAFMQRFMLFLGHPLYTIAVVLGAFLVFAGMGSGYATRFVPQTTRLAGRPLVLAAVSVACLALSYLFLLPPLLQHGITLSIPIKMLVTLALIAPLAFCMGMPFPLGLARVAAAVPPLVPWAWGINGCAAVLSAVLATVLAIHFGFTTVIALAAGLYAFAAVLLAGTLD